MKNAFVSSRTWVFTFLECLYVRVLVRTPRFGCAILKCAFLDCSIQRRSTSVWSISNSAAVKTLPRDVQQLAALALEAAELLWCKQHAERHRLGSGFDSLLLKQTHWCAHKLVVIDQSDRMRRSSPLEEFGHKRPARQRHAPSKATMPAHGQKLQFSNLDDASVGMEIT